MLRAESIKFLLDCLQLHTEKLLSLGHFQVINNYHQSLFTADPILFVLGKTTHKSHTAKIASDSTPSKHTAFGLIGFEGFILAHPASAADHIISNSCEEDAATVTPKAVT